MYKNDSIYMLSWYDNTLQRVLKCKFKGDYIASAMQQLRELQDVTNIKVCEMNKVIKFN